jgi:hypothetical protein
MRWEWEGGAVPLDGQAAEVDAERADEDDRDYNDRDVVSRWLCAGARG